jgi:hypothetical protein
LTSPHFARTISSEVAVIYVTGEGEEMRANTEVRGVPVYLDQWAIIDLARRRPDLGRRFIDAIHAGRGTLLFSVVNLWEIGGPQQDSKQAVSAFLSAIGPHWIPIDSVGEVLQREFRGEVSAPTALDILGDFVRDRRKERDTAGRPLDPKDPSFFDLGRVALWLKSGPDRETLDWIYAEVRRVILMMRDRYDRGDPAFEEVTDEPLIPGQRTVYVFKQLTFMMIKDAKSRQLEKNDFADLCHAMIALSFGVIATLDKKWRDRAKAIKHIDKLARVYYAEELENFVADLETSVPSWSEQQTA